MHETMQDGGHQLVAVAALVLVAAVTPGPNNLVVLRAAAGAGLVGALPAIAGILAGSLALLALVAAGAGAAFAAEPRLRAAIAIGGSLYLAWLGVRLLRARRGRDAGGQRAPLDGALALFAFQFLNPKAWLMVVTATAAAPALAFWQLAAVFTVVPAACLILWSASGAALSRLLARPAVATWFDRSMGALLVACAVALAVQS